MNSTVNIEALEQQLQAKIEQIDEAIAKTRQNETADIGFMDSEVATLCQTILKADSEESKALEPKMIEMIAKLDELAVELKDYQDRLNPDAQEDR